MNRTFVMTVVSLLAGASLLTGVGFTQSVLAADNSAAACGGKVGVVLAAKTPEVDLFDAATNGKRISSVPKAKFPTCLPILEQSPARMLKVEIEGKQYWLQPHMVQIRAANTVPPVCRTLAADSDSTKTGATRGLGEGC